MRKIDKNKLLISASVVMLSLGVIIAVSRSGSNDIRPGSSDPESYTLTLDSGNGAVTGAATYKRTTGTAQTSNDNDIEYEFKKGAASSGNLVALSQRGYYANTSPLNGFSSISVTGSSLGNAELWYGPTSAYLPHKVDLGVQSSVTSISDGNYFKIVATSGSAVINSISVTYSCDSSASNGGLIAYDNSSDVVNNWASVSYNGTFDKYQVVPGANIADVAIASVPDYYYSGGSSNIVTLVRNNLLYSASNISEVYFPETINEFSDSVFRTSSTYTHITEYTLPRELSKISGKGYIPKGNLEILNIHSRNLGIDSSYALLNPTDFPELTTINISSDVETLPYMKAGSWPTALTAINYEGTSGDWSALVKKSGKTEWEAASLAGITVNCLED